MAAALPPLSGRETTVAPAARAHHARDPRALVAGRHDGGNPGARRRLRFHRLITPQWPPVAQ
jgi:hypothetical protein